MSCRISILKTAEVGLLGREADQPQDPGTHYVSCMVRDGARRYVDNANVETRALIVDGKLLPLVISEGTYGNTDVCSPYVHYVEYTLEELAKRQRVSPHWLETIASPLMLLLKKGQIDRVVYINNWLLSTNPSSELSTDQIAVLTAHLTTTYPDSALVFRSVNPTVDEREFDALRRNGYKLIRSRRVYLLDTADKRHLEHKNVKTDVQLLERTPYQLVRSRDALVPYAARMTQLYRELYLDKHSSLNPHFNEDFFALTLRDRFFEYRALVKDGKMDAFASYFIQNRVMTGCLIGYALGRPRRLGLYRMAMAIFIAEAAERGLLLNLSGGAGSFKKLRGAIPAEEFDAVYDHHLPVQRRLVWIGLSIAGSLAVRRGARPASSGSEIAGGRRKATPPAASSYDWNGLAKTWREARPQPLWRSYCDALNTALLRPWLPAGTVGRLLKTDVFDEAFGEGLYSWVRAHARLVFGIDVSGVTLAAARSRWPGLRTINADARRLPFRDGTFEVVVSISTLDHFDSAESIVTSIVELARTLRPGGLLLLTMDNPVNPVVALRNALPFRWLNRLGLVPYYVGRTAGPRRLRRILSGARFEVLETVAVMHCPRVLALPVANLLDRFASVRTKTAFLRCLMAIERLGALPTRFLTGHFVAVRAVRR